MPDATKYSSKLSSSRILIIGGTSGIGYAVAEACLEAGAHVTLCSSRASSTASASASLLAAYPSATARLAAHTCDLSDAATLEANIAALFAAVGPLNHIVYTAADPLAIMPLADVSLERVTQAGMTRFFAPLLVAKHAAAVLPKTPRSSITLTTGVISERPMPDWTVINSFATGLQGMTRGLALDLKPIRVNLVSPGTVETPLWKGMSEEAYAEMKKASERRSTTGVFGRAEDVAEAYLYCLRDSNVTGSMISTNSGTLLL
ncbi:hypothetical protein MMC13_002547 [Lambiella insularis]|nr:hypothetical protein [Lambiella insularis]